MFDGLKIKCNNTPLWEQSGRLHFVLSVEELGQSVSELKEIIKAGAKTKEPRKYLTRAETSKMLHVTLNTLYRWEKCGLLRPIRIGARVYYLNEEVETTLTRKV